MKLFGRLVEVSTLSADDRGRMFDLMDRHYCDVGQATFESDLDEKQWVIQVFHKSTGELCGFSTQMVIEASVENRRIKALFSGDTIIDRQQWGDTALMQAGGQLALSLVDAWPDAELYWFLISQGYKTYRFLPVFFHSFFPRYDAGTPDSIQQVIDTLARLKFAKQYDSSRGVVSAQPGQYHLRDGVADITAERCQDPHIKFFAERNPGHTAGDELCCIARLSRDNFTEAAYRVLRASS